MVFTTILNNLLDFWLFPYIFGMNYLEIVQKYCIDERSFAEKNARSMALAYERLLKGKTAQATRLFAYNHALNQSNKEQLAGPAATKPSVAPKLSSPTTSSATAKGKPCKVRVWKGGKILKQMNLPSDNEQDIIAKIKALGLDWEKVTVYDPKGTTAYKKFTKK